MNMLARVGARIFARATKPNRNPGGRHWIWMPAERAAGVWVTHDEAVKLSAVWACCSVITKSVASSVWEVYEEGADGNREFRRSSPLYRLLNVSPNGEMTAFAWREAALWQGLLRNHYSEIERNALGQPVALWPLDPDRCTLQRNETTRDLELRVTDEEGGETVLPYGDVFHVKGPGADGLLGYDLVSLAARVFGQAAAADEYGGAFFANGTNMGGVLSVNAKMSESSKDAIVQRLSEKHGGPRKAFGMLLLEGADAKFQPVGAKGDEAQILETRQHLVEEVCRWFGVPPHKIAHLLRSTFNNIEHQGLEFTRDALTPWCERLRQEAGAKLVRRRNVATRIDIDWLAEGDAKNKAETDKMLVSGGLMTVNEIRRRRGLNTVGPEGDRLMVQGQMIPLERIGEQESTPALPPPDRPDAGEAARALFAVAARRSLRRMELRALDAAKAAKGDLPERLRSMADDAARYLVDQVTEQVGILRRLGLQCAEPDMIDMAASFVADDLDRVGEVFGRGSGRLDLATDDRANEIAGAFASAVMETVT